MGTLRALAVRGGTILAARQAVSLAVGLGGTVLLTRLLGPMQYGRFAAALAVEIYLVGVAQMGMLAWLVRRGGGKREKATAFIAEGAEDAEGAEEISGRARASARTLLLFSGAVVAGIGVVLLPWLEDWWGGAGVRTLLIWMLLGIPLQTLTLVPLSELERRLDYQTVAATETVAQVTQYLVSISLVLAGLGVGALVIGWWVQQLILFVVLQWRSLDRFVFGFDGALVAQGLKYGLGYASSIWTWQLRDLVNPLIVGRFAGVEGVALVALAVRIVDAASFVKAAAWRLSLPTLARLQGERAKLSAAVREGMRVQVFALAPILLAMVLVVPALVPWLFGEQWLGVRPLIPLVAAGTLANAMFNLHSAALYARGENFAVTRFHAIFVLAFAAAAYRLVPLVSVSGYGLAELVAMPAYVAVYFAFRRATRLSAEERAALGETAYRASTSQRLELFVGAAAVVALAGSAWNAWWIALGVAPLVLPAVRTALVESVASVRGVLAARSAA
jgi:O-antigen/teichoic acid export membrane protein